MSLRRRWAGFGMIEILVALVVTALGILGLTALHLRSQQAQMEADQRSQALLLVNDMASRVAVNAPAAGCYDTAGSFVGSGTAPSPCAGYGTTETRLVADSDMALWTAALDGSYEQRSDGTSVGGLIAARGCITPDADNEVFTISVAWQGLAATSAPADSCGEGLYGDDTQRRVVTRQIMIPTLFP